MGRSSLRCPVKQITDNIFVFQMKSRDGKGRMTNVNQENAASAFPECGEGTFLATNGAGPNGRCESAVVPWQMR